jgi:hypothetical protein
MNRCSNCHVWFAIGVRGEERQGECRANAPKPLAVAYSDGRKTLWPLTLASEGCGQWRPVPVNVSGREQIATILGLSADADLDAILQLLRWDRDGFEGMSLEERRKDIEAAKREAKQGTARPLVLSDPDACVRIIGPGDVDPAAVDEGENGA